MLFKLPAEPAYLNKEQQDKVKKLSPAQKTRWDSLYTDYTFHRDNYQKIFDEYKTLPASQLNATLASKKQLEMDMALEETELFKMLNEPFDTTELQKAFIIAENISNQGAVSIRPKETGTGNFPKKQRKPV